MMSSFDYVVIVYVVHLILVIQGYMIFESARYERNWNSIISIEGNLRATNTTQHV